MKYKNLLFLILFPAFVSAQYCIPTGEHPEGINCFQINDLINYGSPDEVTYTYYPPQEFTTTMTIGESYPMQIHTQFIFMDQFKVWVDWNHDFAFSNSELLLNEENGNGNISAYITIPDNPAYIGQHRLRVMVGSDYEPFNACGWSGYDIGEAEDYNIFITDSMVLADYCRPLPNYPSAFPIENFKLNTIHNCASDYLPGGYIEYPDSVFTTELEIGETYYLYMSKSEYGVSGAFSAYVDYNDDHIFDFSEKILERSGATYGEGDITIPNDSSIIGTHKLRLRSSWGSGGVNACDAVSIGETEDYWIKIIAAIPDTDTIVPPPANRWRVVLNLPERQWAYGVTEHYDQGYLMMGSTEDEYTPYQVKTTIDGDTLWTRTYPTTEGRYPMGLNVTSDGGFVHFGQSWDVVYQGGGYLMKANACGDMEWDHNYIFGDDIYGQYHWIENAFETDDGNLMVATHYFTVMDSVSNYVNRFGLAKIDTAGNIIWKKHYSKYYVHDLWKTLQTSDKGFLMNSYAFFPVSWDTSYWHIRTVMIKVDSEGEVEWENVYDTINHIKCRTVASVEVAGEGYLSVGTVWDSLTESDILSTFMTSFDGRMKWVKPVTEDDFYQYFPINIAKVNENRFAILARRNDKCDIYDYRAAIFVVDSAGNVINSTFEGSGLTWPGGICSTSNEKIVVVATTRPGEYQSSFFAMKFNPDLTYDTLYNINRHYDSICDSISPVYEVMLPGDPDIRIYPNPTNRDITVEIIMPDNPEEPIGRASTRESWSISIINAQGRVVRQMNNCLEPRTTVDLKEIYTGLYMVMIKKGNRVWTRKVVRL